MRHVACALLVLAAGCDTRVSLAGRPRECLADNQCVLAFEGDVCRDTCALDHAISIGARAAYDDEVSRKQLACPSTYLAWLLRVSGDCAHGTAPACVDNTCEAVGGFDEGKGPTVPAAPPPGQ